MGETFARIGDALGHIFAPDLPSAVPDEPLEQAPYESVGEPGYGFGEFDPPIFTPDWTADLIQPPGLREPYEEWQYLQVSDGIQEDRFASDLMWAGWFDPDVTPEERRAARETYFDYMGYDSNDFDWDEWREWYEQTAG